MSPARREGEVREWTKRERQSALDALFTASGFGIVRGDWALECPDLVWTLFFNSVADEDGERHDISMAAQLVGRGVPEADWVYMVNDSLTDLPGSSRAEYRHVDVALADPLVVDAEAILIPLVLRLRTPESVLDAWLAGDLGRSRADRIARAWTLASRYGFAEHARRAQAMASVGTWTPEDRWELDRAGLSVGGVKREPRRRVFPLLRTRGR